jgi:acyl carrier protein
MTEPTVSERVKRVMTTVLDIGVGPEGLPDGTLLYSTTVQLDSLRLLHLLTALEAEFGCQIDDEAVMSAELTDVGSVVSLVSAQLDLVRRDDILDDDMVVEDA